MEGLEEINFQAPKRGEPLEGKPRGKRERIDTRRINVRNPRKPDSTIRSLDGKYVHPRPLIGGKDSIKGRGTGWDAKNDLQQLRDRDSKKEVNADKELNPEVLIQPEYTEDDNLQKYYAKEDNDKDFKEYVVPKEREGLELRKELQEAKKQDNFGRKSIIRNPRITRIFK